MRLERLLPWVLMPNIAMAGGGGGGIVLGLIIFLPILAKARKCKHRGSDLN